ncbi:MAG: transposase [Ectobacillus sp.]
MRKQLCITNDHGWCVESLKEQEQKTRDALSLKRIMAVRLVMQGHKGLDVAAFLGIHRQSVSTYVHSFNEGGMDSLLACGKAPGRLPYLSEQEEGEVRRVLTESTPAEEGMGPESYWDTRVLQAFLEERFSVVMTRSGIGEMLKRWGFSYTRPTYRLVKANPKKQKAFQLDIDMVKKPFRRYDFPIRG